MNLLSRHPLFHFEPSSVLKGRRAPLLICGTCTTHKPHNIVAVNQSSGIVNWSDDCLGTLNWLQSHINQFWASCPDIDSSLPMIYKVNKHTPPSL